MALPHAQQRSTDELWLDTFQEVCARAAHEVKGVLNGVSVNLEVVRSRASRNEGGASVGSIANFAESAGGQFARLSDMAEALLMLGRPPREPVEVPATMKQLVVLLEPVANVEGHALAVSEASGAGAVRARGNVVRLVLARALLAALDQKTDVRCDVELGDDAVVRITAGGDAIQIPADICAAAARSSIRIESDGGCISLAFPRAGRRAHERA
jgi:hypothetical protein